VVSNALTHCLHRVTYYIPKIWAVKVGVKLRIRRKRGFWGPQV